MTVQLQIAGFNMTGHQHKVQDVPDGSTITIDRLPDGSVCINVSPPKEGETPAEATHAASGKKLCGEAPSDGIHDKSYFQRDAVYERIRTDKDPLYATADQFSVIHADLRHVQAVGRDLMERARAEALHTAKAEAVRAAEEIVRKVLTDAMRTGIGLSAANPSAAHY